MTTNLLQTASRAYVAQIRFLFHCHIKIKIPREYGELILDACFDLLEQIDRRYNSYQANSYFDQINQNAGSWTDIDEVSCRLLEDIKFVSQCTKGSYDISCMPLLRLWGFYEEANHRLPHKEDITAVLTKVDYRCIEMRENSARISKGQELMTGSFIKSFAVDRLVAFLKNKGISDAIINAGGSTLFGINDHKHPQWTVHVPNPLKPEERPEQLSLRNQSFSLSASAHNRIIIDGRSYGHVLNSISGYPVSTLQVGVWSNEAFVADILSTAIFSVESRALQETVQLLRERFRFNYFRIEHNGDKTTDRCF